MKIAVDTNVLARAVLQDDPRRGRATAKLLEEATLIAISLPGLCESVRILRRGAKFCNEDVAQSLRDLLAAAKSTSPPAEINSTRAPLFRVAKIAF